MSDLARRLYQSVGRHFLTLSCVQSIPETSERKSHVFSGFLVDVDGMWFYITAGHTLKRIRIALAAGSSFDIWRLGDQTAGNRFKDIAVPYDFNLGDWLVLEDADVGLDYAAVLLDGLYRAQLEAGGALPLGKEAWGDHMAEHNYWALVGIPSETVDYDGVTLISAGVVVAPVTSTEQPPIAALKAQNQFYTTLAPDSIKFMKDIDGMSGGP